MESRGLDTSEHPFDCDHAALHHAFDAGWMWQLRFNDETVSAGFVQDLNRGERPDLSSVKPALPFALEELEVFGRSTLVMWAYIRPSAGSDPGGKVRKLDIDVSDESGKVCARLKGLSLRELTGELKLAASPSVVSDDKAVGGEVGTFLLTPVWDSVGINKNRSA